jgi:hypothetical protein
VTVVVNSIEREDQENKRQNDRNKLDGLSAQMRDTLQFLVQSQGQPNEAERRRRVLEALRGKYVIEHPDAPITMLTGNLWPPQEWMEQRLRELGETFHFILPPTASIPSSSPLGQGRLANISNERVAEMLKSAVNILLFEETRWRGARRDIERDLGNKIISQEEASAKRVKLLAFWREESKDVMLLACDLRTETLSPNRVMNNKYEFLSDKSDDALFVRLAKGRYDLEDVRPTMDYLRRLLDRFKFDNGVS